MPFKSIRFVRYTLSSIATFFVLASAAVAGPPLICHPFDIGNAKSLPWISHDWNLTGAENYDTHDLSGDTLAILNSSQVPLIHMETLRRATLYARKDPVVAKQLLLQLVTRAKSAEASSSPDAFALFDAAYLTEAFETNDHAYICNALDTAARAKGMGDISKATGLSRESLYKTFKETARPEFETVRKVMGSLGVKLVAEPIEEKGKVA